MECAAAGRTGRSTYTRGAYGQADQCRVSDCSLDPGGQHHDAGAGHRRDAGCAAPAGIDCQRDSAVTASCSSGGAHAGCGEKAGGPKTAACALRTGFDCTGTGTGTGTSTGTGSRRCE